MSARTQLALPSPNGEIVAFEPRFREPVKASSSPPTSRAALAAAHVVADPLRNCQAGRARLDWETTLSFRHHLWQCGLGVAEAMDTAQRGMGLDWPACRELIQRSCAEAATVNGRIACGAGTDQLDPGRSASLAEITRAYEEQAELVEAAGGQVVLMASRHLAATARGPEDYVKVVGHVLEQLERPPILHWLGEVFDPHLVGYWGSENHEEAAETLLSIVREYRVEGVKISLLDQSREEQFRRRLPAGVRLYTGDDFHYPELIQGDGQRHSDALLGVFDAIASVASAALAALDADEVERYDALLGPTVPLARELFTAPTLFYKTGIVFLAYLNGHQSHFRMVGGLESARSLLHLSRLFRLADQAGVLADPERAVARMRHVLTVGGIDQPGVRA